jgi:hypothetical protein
MTITDSPDRRKAYAHFQAAIALAKQLDMPNGDIKKLEHELTNVLRFSFTAGIIHAGTLLGLEMPPDVKNMDGIIGEC